ncbi:PilZ domain-containing protein [Nitrospira sp. Nam74]
MLILKADRLGTTARVPVCYPVIFQTDWYMDEGEILNLSLPGCAIESPTSLIPGEYVRLQMLLPRHAIHVEVAKVRWTERNRFGLEFLKMEESGKKKLCEFVSNFYA